MKVREGASGATPLPARERIKISHRNLFHGFPPEVLERREERLRQRREFAETLIAESGLLDATTPREEAHALELLDFVLDVPAGTDLDVRAIWQVARDVLSRKARGAAA